MGLPRRNQSTVASYPCRRGYYKIVARHSGKVLDVQLGGLNNGTPVWQVEENGTAAQQWQIIDVGGGYSRIMARHSGKALDVAGGSTTNGAQIHQWDYFGIANQQWLLRPLTYYEVVAKHSGKCLHVEGASTASGALVLQWDCLGATHQQWQVVPVGRVLQDRRAPQWQSARRAVGRAKQRHSRLADGRERHGGAAVADHRCRRRLLTDYGPPQR